MKHGVSGLITDRGLDMIGYARLIEDLGFESLFMGEHTVIPLQVKTTHPFVGGVADEYVWRARANTSPLLFAAASSHVDPSSERYVNVGRCPACLSKFPWLQPRPGYCRSHGARVRCGGKVRALTRVATVASEEAD